MLSLSEIEKWYPESLKPFRRFLLREYLQCKLLEIVFQGRHQEKLCFLGGTYLRLVHNQQRFSEDLDFDNFNLNETEFEAITKHIARELDHLGYKANIRKLTRGTFHCYIRFPNLLYQEGLSGHSEEKILIQLDTEPQFYAFTPDSYILNRFDVLVRIPTTPSDVLLAQKCYAVLNRKRNKGRDFFDILFLLGKGSKPDYRYLHQKIGIDSPDSLKSAFSTLCASIDMQEMAADVSPFLFNPGDAQKVSLFPDYIQQVL